MTDKALAFDLETLLDSAEARAEYLNIALAEGDPAFIAHALGVVARAYGMAPLAAAADVRREALYRSLSMQGNPSLRTFLKVLEGMGIVLHARATSSAIDQPPTAAD